MDQLGFLGMRRLQRQIVLEAPIRETRSLTERRNPFIELSDKEFR